MAKIRSILSRRLAYEIARHPVLFTVEALAEAAGLPEATIRTALTDDYLISLGSLQSIALALDLHPTALINELPTAVETEQPRAQGMTPLQAMRTLMNGPKRVTRTDSANPRH